MSARLTIPACVNTFIFSVDATNVFSCLLCGSGALLAPRLAADDLEESDGGRFERQ